MTRTTTATVAFAPAEFGHRVLTAETEWHNGRDCTPSVRCYAHQLAGWMTVADFRLALDGEPAAEMVGTRRVVPAWYDEETGALITADLYGRDSLLTRVVPPYTKHDLKAFEIDADAALRDVLSISRPTTTR